MAIATWPASLPVPLLDLYSESPVFAKRSFKPEVGPEIESRRGTVKISRDNWVLHCTAEQVEVFEEFVEIDLQSAVEPFLITHPRRDEQVRVRLVGETPCRVDRAGIDYRISLSVTIIG
ncbi:hypothetical protein [Oricola sp.]|uniref:hypothetical protein n=1 Tax=Oricola sp. TaxID=1979950 RepID=UPI0025EA7FD4|nr:hypothetical protein [Oricola sp.]MCI5078737.1 hypothetical protein [Oricola sp.]